MTTPLVDAFVAAAGRSVPGPARERLASVLEARVDEAVRAHPELDLAPEAFAAHLGELSSGEDDPLALLDAVRIDDLYLTAACIAGRPGALAVFESSVLARIDAAIAGAGASADGIDEIKQRVREKLLVARPDRPAKLAAYHGRGSLRSWVRVVAVREALALLGKGRRFVEQEEDDALEGSLEIDRDPELAYLKDEYRQEFRRSFADALAGLQSRDRTVLRLQHIDGLTLDQTAAILNVHRATIARWNTRIRSDLLASTRQALAGRLNIDVGELESVMRLIQSNLEASVRRLLAPE